MDKLSYKIFYTDDDADDQELFQETVKNISHDHKVFSQYNGIELMNLLKESSPEPDLIFLDLNMPHKNGFQVLKEMREEKELSKLPVIVFSTSNDLDTIDTCKNLGANGYLCKPTSYAKMRSMLEKVLSVNWNERQSKNNFYIDNQ